MSCGTCGVTLPIQLVRDEWAGGFDIYLHSAVTITKRDAAAAPSTLLLVLSPSDNWISSAFTSSLYAVA